MVLHFSYYTLMIFVMLLSVILPSMLMTLHSTLKVIRHLICGNNSNWLLNFNMIKETLLTGARSSLSISRLEKLNRFCIGIALRHGCSPANLLHIFRPPIPRNTSGWLLLYFGRCSSELAELVPLPYFRGSSTRYNHRL